MRRNLTRSQSRVAFASRFYVCINEEEKTWNLNNWNYIDPRKNVKNTRTLRVSDRFVSHQPPERRAKECRNVEKFPRYNHAMNSQLWDFFSHIWWDLFPHIRLDYTFRLMPASRWRWSLQAELAYRSLSRKKIIMKKRREYFRVRKVKFNIPQSCRSSTRLFSFSLPPIFSSTHDESEVNEGTPKGRRDELFRIGTRRASDLMMMMRWDEKLLIAITTVKIVALFTDENLTSVWARARLFFFHPGIFPSTLLRRRICCCSTSRKDCEDEQNTSHFDALNCVLRCGITNTRRIHRVFFLLLLLLGDEMSWWWYE